MKGHEKHDAHRVQQVLSKAIERRQKGRFELSLHAAHIRRKLLAPNLCHVASIWTGLQALPSQLALWADQTEQAAAKVIAITSSSICSLPSARQP